MPELQLRAKLREEEEAGGQGINPLRIFLLQAQGLLIVPNVYFTGKLSVIFLSLNPCH